MPVKPRKDKRRPALGDNITAYLRDEQPPRDFEIFLLEKPDSRHLPKIWARERADILRDWVRQKPGTRPSLWWRYDAPRSPEIMKGTFWEGSFCIPRERVGGQGVTSWEKHRAVLPQYKSGMPDSWYEIDLDDPPRYEAQAAYLKRQGLLTPAERRAIAHRPEAWEPEAIDTTDFTED